MWEESKAARPEKQAVESSPPALWGPGVAVRCGFTLREMSIPEGTLDESFWAGVVEE